MRWLFAFLAFAALTLGGHDIRCPFDQFEAVWTGQTQGGNGQIWYVMSCPQGHRTLSPARY